MAHDDLSWFLKPTLATCLHLLLQQVT